MSSSSNHQQNGRSWAERFNYLTKKDQMNQQAQAQSAANFGAPQQSHLAQPVPVGVAYMPAGTDPRLAARLPPVQKDAVVELAKQGTADILLQQLEFFGSKVSTSSAGVEHEKKAPYGRPLLTEVRFGESSTDLEKGLGPDYDNFEDEDTFAEEKDKVMDEEQQLKEIKVTVALASSPPTTTNPITDTLRDQPDREEGEIIEDNPHQMEHNLQNTTDSAIPRGHASSGYKRHNSSDENQSSNTNGQGVWNNQTRQFEKKPPNSNVGGENGPPSGRDFPPQTQTQGKGHQNDRVWDNNNNNAGSSYRRNDNYNQGGQYSGGRPQSDNYYPRSGSYSRGDQRSHVNEPHSNSRSTYVNNNYRQGNHNAGGHHHHQDRRQHQSTHEEPTDHLDKRFGGAHSRTYERNQLYNNNAGYDRRGAGEGSGNRFGSNYNPDRANQHPPSRKEDYSDDGGRRGGNERDPPPLDSYRPDYHRSNGPDHYGNNSYKRDYYPNNQRGSNYEGNNIREGGEQRFYNNSPQAQRGASGGFQPNRYAKRSPIRQKSRSRSSSPPRGGSYNNYARDGNQGLGGHHQNTRGHHNQRGHHQPYNNRVNSFQQHRDGYQSQRGPYQSQLSQVNGYYLSSVDGGKQFISKSDYHNPNNPNYLGGGNKIEPAFKKPVTNRERSTSMRKHSQRSRSRSPVGSRRYSCNASEPRNQQMRQSPRSNERVSDNGGDQITRKVAASSPSRPNLEIVRRVPSSLKPKAVEHPQRDAVSCEREEKPQSQRDATCDEKIDKESNLTFRSPRSETNSRQDEKRAHSEKAASGSATPPLDGNADANGDNQKSQQSNWSQKDEPIEDSHPGEPQPQENQDDNADDIPAFSGQEEKPQSPPRRSRTKSPEAIATLKAPQSESKQQSKGPEEDDESRPYIDTDENEVQQKPVQHFDMKRGQKIILDGKGNEIDPEKNCNIYVAGIPKRTTEDSLRKVFSRFGSILNVHVIKDNVTKVPRGFAYLLFKSGREANQAIREMDQTSPFNDWKITVEHAKRGEVVTPDTLDKYQQNSKSKPYGSCSYGYDYNQQTNYVPTRGTQTSYNANSRGSNYPANSSRPPFGNSGYQRDHHYQRDEYREGQYPHRESNFRGGSNSFSSGPPQHHHRNYDSERDSERHHSPRYQNNNYQSSRYQGYGHHSATYENYLEEQRLGRNNSYRGGSDFNSDRPQNRAPYGNDRPHSDRMHHNPQRYDHRDMYYDDYHPQEGQQRYGGNQQQYSQQPYHRQQMKSDFSGSGGHQRYPVGGGRYPGGGAPRRHSRSRSRSPPRPNGGEKR